MKLFNRIRKLLPKRLAVVVASAFAIVALPVASLSAASVKLEGSIGVRNGTTNTPAGTYAESVNATYNQELEFRVFYHNLELPDSGKVAEDLRVKVEFPQAAGRNQVVKTTISALDANTITDTATVVLDRDDAKIEYIAGSAKWEHNPGARTDSRITESIADSVILQGTILEDAKPCYEYQAYVIFRARVIVPSVGIYKNVRAAGTNDATTDFLVTQPGARLDYVVTAKNLSNTDLTNVYLRDPLPAGLTYVPGSAKKYYGEFNGTVLTATEANAFFNSKKNVGTLKPGASAHITYQVTVANIDALQCGKNTLKNIAVVDTDQTGEYHDVVNVEVTKVCAETPTYVCELLKIEKTTGRTIKVTDFKTSQTNGATFKNVVINWGDNTTPLTTNTAVNQTHTYANDGTYNIVATATFTVNGVDKTATSKSCEASVTFGTTTTTPPKTLPNTGASDIIGIAAAVTVAGAVAHRYFYGRFTA